MLASISRRRLLHLCKIPAGGGTHRLRPSPSDAFLSDGYSSLAVAGAPASKPCPVTVSYLVSCGLSPAAAAAYKSRICSTSKADAVCALLRRYGFSGADITEIARRATLILTLDPERILRPKLDLFATLGVPPRKLVITPLLLTRSLDNHLVPCIQFLRGILGSDDDVCQAICRTPRALMADLEKNMRPAVDALRRHGLPEKSIAKLLVIEMGFLMVSPDRISEILKDLQALGLCMTDTGFLYGIRAMCCLSRESWLRKMALYRSFGVSDGELRKAIKKQPTILLFSEESIRRKLRFLLDELKLELSDLMGQPVIMAYSMDKCIIPRCTVLSVLRREGKIETDGKLLNALLGNTKVFLKRYVLKYAQDVPDVVKAYEGKIKFDGFKDQDVLIPPKP